MSLWCILNFHEHPWKKNTKSPCFDSWPAFLHHPHVLKATPFHLHGQQIIHLQLHPGTSEVAVHSTAGPDRQPWPFQVGRSHKNWIADDYVEGGKQSRQKSIFGKSFSWASHIRSICTALMQASRCKCALYAREGMDTHPVFPILVLFGAQLLSICWPLTMYSPNPVLFRAHMSSNK